MSFFSMFAKAFTMIARHYDDGVVISARFFQIRDPIRQRGISISNLAVVKMILIFLGKWRRRLIRIVRIVHMHPNKVRSSAMLIEPRFGVLNHFHSAALHPPPPFLAFSLRWKVVVIIETTIKARGERVAIENHRTNKRRGLIALFLQQFSCSHMLRRKRNTKIRYAVHTGQKTGKNRDVRSIRDRAVRERLAETHAFGRQSIQCWSLNLFVSIAADVIRTQRVASNKEDMRRRGWRHNRTLSPDLSRKQSKSRHTRDNN